MTKILVTGAGGYIGSVATYLFLEKGYQVVAVDNYSTGYRQPLELLQKKFPSTLRVYEADLRDDLSFIFEKEHDISVVIHYAASCIVDESMKQPEKYFSNNIGASVNLLKTMVDYRIKKLIFSSTAAVYGEPKNIPIKENDPLNPINVYGESKLMVEKSIHWFSLLKGINYIILRYFNVCGASDDGLIGDSKKPSTLLVQNAVRGALGITPFYLTYPEVNTPDKSPIRDYINVVDLNEAHLKALEYLENHSDNQIINLGTKSGNSVLEIVNTVQNITGEKFSVKQGDSRLGDPERLIASNDLAKKVLGWQPKRTIKDSIESLVKWYKANPKGWKS